MGDLGTFLPLTVSMAAFGAVLLAAALFWAGLLHVVSGLQRDTPMCVQPMKTISAVFVAGGNT
jgi:fatty acid desaturase